MVTWLVEVASLVCTRRGEARQADPHKANPDSAAACTHHHSFYPSKSFLKCEHG